MPSDVQAETLFPFNGIDVSSEFETQPSGTTVDAVNVRAFEPSTLRLRGGSRPGLSRYINQQVSGENLIQHVAFVVRTDTNALTDTEEIPSGTPSTTDPSTGARNPGRSVRTGGSGRQPNRNAGNQQYITFIQAASGTEQILNTLAVPFVSDVTFRNVILVFVGAQYITAQVPPVVTDNAGRAYTQIALINHTAGNQLSAWVGVADTSGGATTVTVTCPGTAILCVKIAEYKNVQRTDPTDVTTTNSDASTTYTTLTAGTLQVPRSFMVAVGAFFFGGGFGVGTDFTLMSGSAPASGGRTLRTETRRHPNSGLTISVDGTTALALTGYCALGFLLNKA